MSSIHHGHSPEAIARRLEQEPRQSYIRDFIYGGIDGAVTTFAIVAGVVGASLSLRTILVLGLANLLADGFSMAASNFLGTRAEVEERRFLEAFERGQVVKEPEGEREEVRQILIKQGFEGDLLEKAVDNFTSDQDKWVRFMLHEEYGLSKSERSPMRGAAYTFVAFVVCGSVPLLPFWMGMASAFRWAWVLTGVTFFAIGSVRSRWSPEPWWRTGIETLVVGSAAAGMAYGIGSFLGGGAG